jgi:chaperonin GroEL (HSP60 family)
MSTDPVRIRQEIERTRNSLSSDVDALAYKVSPGRIVDDRKQRAQDAVRKVRDKVMGTANDLGGTAGSATSTLSDRASSAAATVSDRASSAASAISDAAGQAPVTLRAKSEGNPVAAGLIAFGIGWLASSLLPATGREQQAATQLREKAGEHSGTVTRKLGEAAQEIRDELREPAREAADSVRSTASDAAYAVKDDSRVAAREVRDHARQEVRS